MPPVSPVQPIATTPAARRPAAAVAARATAPAANAGASPAPAPAPSGDALAQGKAARDPKAFQTALVRLTAEAVDAYNKREQARQRFEAGQLGKPELHAAEAAVDTAYARLRELQGSVGTGKRLAWRLRHGFDLGAAWARHGIPLPPEQRWSAQAQDKRFTIAAGASLAVTFGSAIAAFMAPWPGTWMVAVPLAFASALFGGALVMVQANGAGQAEVDLGPDRIPSRDWLDARGDHYAGASPEAYKTALIHLTTRAKMAKEHLDGTKALAGRGRLTEDHVRLARLELHDAYRGLHALAGAVGEVKATAWKAQGFDVAAAWKTYGMPLPPLESLDRTPVHLPLEPIARKPAQYMGGLIAAVVGAIGADLVAAGRIGGIAGRLLLAIYRVHPLFAIVVVGGAGFLAGGLFMDGLNRLLGRRAPAKGPTD